MNVTSACHGSAMHPSTCRSAGLLVVVCMCYTITHPHPNSTEGIPVHGRTTLRLSDQEIRIQALITIYLRFDLLQ